MKPNYNALKRHSALNQIKSWPFGNDTQNKLSTKSLQCFSKNKKFKRQKEKSGSSDEKFLFD